MQIHNVTIENNIANITIYILINGRFELPIILRTEDIYMATFFLNIPNELYEKFYGASMTLGEKLQEFADAISGKANTTSPVVANNHFKMINDLRLNNPEKYKQLIFFGHVYQTLPIDQRIDAANKFFSNF
jgi:hypothetical protein